MRLNKEQRDTLRRRIHAHATSLKKQIREQYPDTPPVLLPSHERERLFAAGKAKLRNGARFNTYGYLYDSLVFPGEKPGKENPHYKTLVARLEATTERVTDEVTFGGSQEALELLRAFEQLTVSDL